METSKPPSTAVPIDHRVVRRAAVAALPLGTVLAVDRDLRVVMAEGFAVASDELEPGVLVGRPLADVVSAETYRALEPRHRAAQDRGEVQRFEYRPQQGRWHWVCIAPLHAEGECVGSVAVTMDVTEQKRAEQELREVTLQFETAFSAAPNGMAVVGLDGRFLRCNAALCELTGYPESELVELTFQNITHPDDLDADVSQLDQVLAGQIDSYAMEKRYFTKAGHLIWVHLAVSLVRDEQGEPMHFISQIKDVSERRRMTDRLREMAEHDPVTDLFNRRRFEDELERQLALGERHDQQGCLLMLDVDDFKAINDRHGHKLGDTALRGVARVMRQRLRSTDVLARVGGDEFAVLLPNTDLDGASELAEDVRAAVASTPISLAGVIATMTVSVGVHSLGGPAADLVTDPFVAADRAMYRAKAAGKDRVVVAP